MAADDDRGLEFIQNAGLLQSKKGGPLVKWNDNEAREALIQCLTAPPITDEDPSVEEGSVAYEDEAPEEGQSNVESERRIDVQSQTQASAIEDIFEPDANGTKESTATASLQSGPTHGTQDVLANSKPWQQIRLKNNDTKFAVRVH